MPINFASGGQMPGPSGETQSADGRAEAAPADMSVACQQAADAATAHSESEAGKVAMGVLPSE